MHKGLLPTKKEAIERNMGDEICELLGVRTFPGAGWSLNLGDEVTLTPEQAVKLQLIEEGQRW